MGDELESALRDLSGRGRPYGPERVYRLAVDSGNRRDRRRRVASVVLLLGIVVVGAVALRLSADWKGSDGVDLQGEPRATVSATSTPLNVLASSDVAGRRWEFVSFENAAYGRCLQVRGPSGKTGGCGVSTPFAGYPAPLSGGLRFDDTFYAVFAGTVPSDVDSVYLTLRNGRSVDARAANGAWLLVIPASQLTQGTNDEDSGLIVARAEAYSGGTKRWAYEP